MNTKTIETYAQLKESYKKSFTIYRKFVDSYALKAPYDPEVFSEQIHRAKNIMTVYNVIKYKRKLETMQ